MAKRRTPTSLGRPENIDELRQATEEALSLIQQRQNAADSAPVVDVGQRRVTNVARASQAGDAVPLGQMNEALQGVIDRSLSRPRKAGLVPAQFRTFTATHYLQRPELACADAEPAIELLVKLPSQVDRNSQLVSVDLLKRNTEYVELRGLEWGTLTADVTASATTFLVDNVDDIEIGALYKIDDELFRVADKSTGTATVERGQELSTAAAHTSGTLFQWATRVPRDAFSADDNGALTTRVSIDNPTRTHVRVFEGESYNEFGAAGVTGTATASLAPAPAITDLVANGRFGEAVLTWSETGGSTYRYRVYRSVGTPLTAPFPAAKQYAVYEPDGTGVEMFIMPVPKPGDANNELGTWAVGGTSNNIYAAVEGINILCSSSGGDTVGPFTGDATPTPAADDVSGLAASESPACGADGATQSEVAVSWSSQPASVAKVRIYMLKDGETNPTLVASADASPVTFITPTIDPDLVQSVSIYAVSVNEAGVENSVLGSPNTTVDLDGQTSAPTPPSGFGCTPIVNGAELRWTPNAECDLYGYEIADTGDVVPALQSDIADAQVIAFVAAGEASGSRVRYLFQETLYEGTSDGTKVIMGEDLWPPNAHVVNGTGKNVHFVTVNGTSPTNVDVQVVSNDGTSITFGAGAIDNGPNARFYIRDTDATHNFYVRAVNNSMQRSEYRPEPPSSVACAPLGHDSTKDQGPADISIAAPGASSGWTVGPIGITNLLGPNISAAGKLAVRAAAKSTGSGNSATFSSSAKLNINNVVEWEVEIAHSDDGSTSLATSVFSFPANTERSNYTYESISGQWRLQNYLPLISLPGQGIASVKLRARNFWGWGPQATVPAVFVPSGGVPYFTGNEASIVAPLTAALTGGSTDELEMNVGRAEAHYLELTKNITVVSPLNRSGGASAGTGDSIKAGQRFFVILKQDATGGRTVTWHSNFKIPAAYQQPSGTPSSYNIWQFYALSSSVFLCASVPVLDVT